MARADNSKGINVKNTAKTMQISFPRKPFEMDFSVHFKGESKKGDLEVYSLPIQDKGGLMVCAVLSGDHLSEDVLQEKKFKEYFNSYLVKYLFYSPDFFSKNQKFQATRSEYQGIPILSFEYSYQDEETQLIKGTAVLHENSLFFLFYLAPEKNYDNELLKDFVGSFHLQ